MVYEVPKITDELLAERMQKIHFYVQGMVSARKKLYDTDETNPEFFSWVKSIAECDPRTHAFNFVEDPTKEVPDFGLDAIKSTNIVIKVGGYYGFLKMTMAEVLSQVPEDIVDEVVGFAIDPAGNMEVVDGGNYQTVDMLWLRKTELKEQAENLPLLKDLMKPLNTIRAEVLFDRVKPSIYYNGKKLERIQAESIESKFMILGIWGRINGSHVWKTEPGEVYEGEIFLGDPFFVYTHLDESADVYKPTFLEVISYIPERSINTSLIAVNYSHVDFLMTDEGVIHRAKFQPVYIKDQE